MGLRGLPLTTGSGPFSLESALVFEIAPSGLPPLESLSTGMAASPSMPLGEVTSLMHSSVIVFDILNDEADTVEQKWTEPLRG